MQENEFDEVADSEEFKRRESKSGMVYLIGAGPGDPDLVTVKAMECLKRADVVIYDRLVNLQILRNVSDDCELIFAGKSREGHFLSQEEINRIMIERARSGDVVVRLKGGDPFIFGRGGEEAEALARAGIPFEVIPGVTSAYAAPAYAGIPLTHREFASVFTVATGSEDPTKPESAVNWKRIANLGGTIVIMMGWGNLSRIVSELITAGLNPFTPSAVIMNGTLPSQKTVTASLKELPQKVEEEGIAPPIIVVIGEVVNLRKHVAWFEKRPLFGKRVLITRSREQSYELSRLFEDEGAQPIELPVIRIEPLEDFSSIDDAICSLDSFDWIVFTSVNGVEEVFKRVYELGLDARAFAGVKIAAIGSATATSLLQKGLKADLIPKNYTTYELAEALRQEGIKGKKVLLFRSELMTDELLMMLRSAGAEVQCLKCYRVLPELASKKRAISLLSQNAVDVICFTSPSTVHFLMKLIDNRRELLNGKTIACIGPVTAKALEEYDLKADIVAEIHTISGLVEAVKDFFVSMIHENQSQ
jgi:uroporphyrinogen III methyltransferase/synthase